METDNFLITFKNLTKDDLFKIIVVIIFFFYIVNKIHFSVNTFISLTISIFLFYLILSRKKKEQADNFKINNDILENVNIFKYKYLALDVKIINIYYELRFIKNYNLTSFNDSLKFINNLLKIYYICKKNMLSKIKLKTQL